MHKAFFYLRLSIHQVTAAGYLTLFSMKKILFILREG